ncbi:MAG: LysM peptidoglycan-binding domain-containing protein [Chloroflexi bacterium]|nr:LysM peptidoglycan-binding domain-containing protein [Chloroflexota bacterium]
MFRTGNSAWKWILALSLLLSACAPQTEAILPTAATSTPSATPSPIPTETLIPSTPLPTRPAYDPGTLVEYTAQNGDNLIALAARFNTSIEEILVANPIIPDSATTLPAGLPMQIPIYYRAYWGSAYRIIPDSQFVNGPAAMDFDTQAFVDEHAGWLKNYGEYASGRQRTGAGLVDVVATNFSVSPRLLLALLEYQAGALTQPVMDPDLVYPLGYERRGYGSVYLQLVWAANQLNDGYYAWRNGKLIEFDLNDGTIYRPDPWQNAASVTLQIYFNEVLPSEQFDIAISPEGFAHTYASLFGDPWQNDVAHLPGSLAQPEFRLPFSAGEVWAFTGGPHTGWGQGEPWAALDFAPGEGKGCFSSNLWAIALADGTVIRTDVGIAVLDLDGDGDERTGWVIFYLHVSKNGRAQVGDTLLAGQPVGRPSCEGGSSTGTHVHIARKYNGEWIEAAGALPFVMEGWTPMEGGAPYAGLLTRMGYQVRACACSDAASAITSAAAAVPLSAPEVVSTEISSNN